MSERIYDEEIHPLLAKVAEIAKANKIPVLASVEYSPGRFATTMVKTNEQTLHMAMLQHCSESGTHIDQYLIGLVKYANRHGIDISSSIFLGKYAEPKP